MRDRFVLILVLAFAGVCASAAPEGAPPVATGADDGATIVGRASVVDGDTLTVTAAGGPVRVRLHAIDAPELAQRCTGRRGTPFACGAMARSALIGLIGEEEVRCAPRAGNGGRDRWGRVVAVCTAGGQDLGRELVRLGWARAFTRYGRDYAGEEDEARRARLGFWGGGWQAPAEWRRER